MLRMVAAEEGWEPLVVRDETVSLLGRHPWPGNVRQLGNVVLKGLKAAVRDEAAAILPKHLGAQFLAEVKASGRGTTRRKGLTEAVVREAIEREDGNVSAAARRLGVSEQSLWYWIRTRRIEVGHASEPVGAKDRGGPGRERAQ
jgi:transcriptional regulator with PAS, ATPase and Fis domain